jgi:hypothetical protein
MSLPIGKKKLNCTLYLREGGRNGTVLGKGVAELYEVRYRSFFNPWFGTADMAIDEKLKGSLADPTNTGDNFVLSLNGREVGITFDDEGRQRIGIAVITAIWMESAPEPIPGEAGQHTMIEFQGTSNL